MKELKNERIKELVIMKKNILISSCTRVASVLPLYCLRVASVMCMLIVLGISEMWGEEVTFTFNTDAGIAALGISKPDAGKGTSLSTDDPYVLSGVSMAVTHGSTDTRIWNSSGTLDLRVYASGGSLTFTAPGNITDVLISGNTVSGFSANVGTYNTITGAWSGEAASVTFTAGGTQKVNTIKVTYTAADPYTVNFNAQGGTCGTASLTEASGGAGVTLPAASPTAACASEGWAFYGWATVAVGSSTTTAPTIVGKAGDTYHPLADNTTLHAVYATGEYTKETSAITAGGKYLIVANSGGHNYVMTNNYSKPGDYGQLAGELIDETTTNKYHVASVPADYVFTIVTTASVSVGTGDWMIKNIVDNMYVSPDFKNFYVSTITSADGNTITWNGGNSGWDVVNVYESENMLQYDAANNVFISASPATSLLIYKETTTPAYWSNPSCCDKGVAVSYNSAGSTHVSAMTFSAASIATCGGASTRQVTVSVTPTSGYLFKAGDELTWNTSSVGIPTAPTLVSGPTLNNGKYEFVYQFAQNDNGSGTFAAAASTLTNYRTKCCTSPGLAYGTGSVSKTFGDGTFTNALTNSNSVSVTYSSSVPGVATVAADGTVTIAGAGTTIITASFAGNATYCAEEASYTLTVNKADISPTLTYSPNRVAVGDYTGTPTVGGNPGNGRVTYAITSASPEGCATINANTGVVTGVAEGSVTVTATVAATDNYNGNTATATVTIIAASYFTNNKTLFIEAGSSGSAWDASACVKAWFRDGNEGGEAVATQWLANSGDGKKIFAAVIPTTGSYRYMTIQRFAEGCGNFLNNNGYVSKADDGGSNVVKTTCASTECVSWSPSALSLYLHGDIDSWAGNLATLSDQNAGLWTATYNNYAPANVAATSRDFRIVDSYGNSHGNGNTTLSGMTVGSTYNITASYDVTSGTLTMGKTFVKGEVSFDLQGHGDAIAKLTNVAAGSKISAPSTPSADYYTFGGWFKEPACTNEWNFATDVVNETMTLYAKWTAIPVTALELNYSSLKRYVGENSVTLNVTSVTPNMADPSVTWSSSNTGVAEVTSAGVVTFASAGTATITATSTVSGGTTATCAVEVRSISGPTMQDEDGTAIDAGEGKPSATWTLGTRTLTASEGTSNYKFKRWIVTNATASDAENATTTLGDPTDNVTVVAEFYKPITVTWKVGTDAASGGTSEVKYGTKVSELPSTPDVAAVESCGDANTFMGWTALGKLEGTGNAAPADLFKSKDDANCTALTANTTYRAVFANHTEDYEYDDENYDSGTFGTSRKLWDAEGDQTLNSISWTLGVDGSSYYGYDSQSSAKGQQVGSSSDAAQEVTLSTSGISGTITSVKITTSGASSINATVGVSVGSTNFTNGGNETVSLTNSSTEYTFTGSATGTITITWTNSSSKAIYFKQIKVDYTTATPTSSTSNYITGCCTPLAAIGGAVEYTNPTTAVLTWNKMSNVDATTPYTITYRTGEAAYGSSNVGAVDLSGAKATCTITDLACNTPYDFKIAVTAAEDYCDKDSVMTETSPKYSITKGSATGGTFTTKISTDDVTESCNGATIAIAATPNAGYTFTSWTITNDDNSGADVTSTLLGGSSTTASTSFTMPSYRVTVTPTFSCVAVNHVDVTGSWDYFGGEEISLTATAYATNDDSSPIAAANITGYQWQKWYNDQWNDVSDAPNISGTNKYNLVITNSTGGNSGSYRCAVTTGATCSASYSDGLEVKVFTLECYTDGPKTYDFTRDGENQRGSVEVTLGANKAYEFKIHADNVYYGNSGTVNEDVTDWLCSTAVENNFTVNSGLGGTFTFTMDYSSSGSSSTVGDPEISVTYPRKTIYLTPGDWNTGGEKFAFYYFRDNGSSAWTDFITADDCGSSAVIPQWNGVKINAVRLNNTCTSPNWADKWNQTGNITVSSNDNVVITGWGPENGDSPYSYGTYTIPTYTISYATGSTNYTSGNAISGEKVSETKTCGEDFTLPNAAVFSTTGYTQTGWATSDGGSQAYAFGGTYATNAAQAFYPAWTANNHTLTWSANGGDALTGDYTTGTVAYGTTIVAPDTPTKTGYTFTGWSPAVPSTMPDDDLTCTATWSATSYTITYNNLNGASNSNPANYTIESSAITLVAPGTRDGYTFAGWYTEEDLADGHEAGTPAIAAGSTGNKTFWAKWTKIHTVTWHVGNGTWSVGQHNVDADNTQVLDGSQIATADMPDDPADNTLSSCASKFMGWSKKNYGSTSGKDDSDYDDLFKKADGSPTISGNTDFYAVFAEVTEDKYWSMGTIDQLSSGSGYATYDGEHTVTGSDGNDYTYTSSNVMASGGNQFRGSSNCGRIYNTSSLGNINRIVLNYSAYKGQMKVYESDSQISSSGTTALTETVSGEDNEIYTYECSGKGYFIVIQEGSNAAKADVTVYFGSSASNYRTQCDANMVRVTYDANGGTTSCTDESHDKRNDYTVCATEPTRDYYEFAGWLCSADSKTYDAGATIDDAVIDADFTLTAQWTPVDYDITYNLYEGTNNGDNPATYNVETTTITLQDPTRGHDRFEGWFTTYSEGVYSDQVTSIPVGSHGDITLHAKWTTRHEIVFDYTESASSGSTTIWRADDEDISASVAGQGSVPSDPSAPGVCDTKVFVGWSKDLIDDETNTRPSDLMKPAEGKVDEDKHYYAVWAIESSESGTVYLYNGSFEQVTSGTAYGNKGKWETSTVFGTGTAGEVRMSSNSSSGSMDLDLSDKTLATTITVTFKMKRYGTEAGTVTLSCMDDGSTASFGSSPFSYPSGDDNWHDYSSTVTSVNAATQSIHFTSTSGKRVYVKDVVVSQTGTVYNYSAYSTSCCATKVTLSQNSPEHGTIVFGKESVGTCGDKEVTLTITPAAGYQLHSYEVATGSGKVSATAVPGIALDNNSNAVQNITLTFASGANGAYDVTASFTEMVASAWTWTKHVGGATITTEPVEVYVGQKVQVDVTYEPAGLLSSHTSNTSYDYSPSPWSNPNLGSPAKAGDHLTVTGTNAGETSVVLNHTDGLTKTINYTVLALEQVHFVDLVHGKAFADSEATLSGDKWTVSWDGNTPTSADWTTPNANSCEEQHLHLVGWIREDWPALVAYLAGTGDAPLTSAIVGAGNDGEGHAYFLAPGASINVQIFNGKTFYAVWAKVE